MRTRVGVFCERVIEAGWLIALVAVPLFFNVYSSRVFEPDKLALLRSIATLMIVAWIVKVIDEGRALPRAEDGGRRGAWRAFARTPLAIPTAAVVAVYLLATALSVVPRVSLWGSYQRLQGTYSTLSYIAISLLMLQTLRRADQVRRLLTLIIVTSLPISLYGVAQHYGLDPLPWGGDTTSRVAGNMGNAIFIAAYLIMVVPLTLSRIIGLLASILAPQDVASEGTPAASLRGPGLRGRIIFGAVYCLVVLVQLLAWSVLGMERGLAVGLLLIVGLTLVAGYLRRPMARFVLLGAYTLILCAQLAAILFTQSRGPWLGLVAGLFFFGLLYLFARRWRVAAVTFVGLAGVLVAFLVLINLPGTPLSGVRDMPYVGRLAQVFETEGGTGKVRVLIWQGALEMIGADPLRAVVGYGPEAMYVAYNPFYPPDLAHLESRNASPDRSHNETFDSLVTTGIIGFAAYMLLFGSLFYYGLLWLGLIRGRGQQRLFLALAAGGALAGALVPIALEGSARFSGVGLPVGFIAGVALYMAASAIQTMMGRGPARESDGDAAAETPLTAPDRLLLVGLLAAIVAHFVEIHFGIAIAATRTYFWIYLALMALIGRRLATADPMVEQTLAAQSVAGAPVGVREARRGGRKHDQRRREAYSGGALASQARGERWAALVPALAIGFVLATAAWDYTTNPLGLTSPLRVIVTSLTTMAARGAADKISLGILWLVLGTALVGVLVTAAERAEREAKERDAAWWARALGSAAAAALGSAGFYALLHAARLAPGVNATNLIYEYAAMMVVFWLALAWMLYRSAPRPQAATRGAWAYAYPVLLVLALLSVDATNMRIVRADVLYKQGLKSDEQANWDGAVQYYQLAVGLAPREDYYYLFLGRALLERAKVEPDAAQRDALFERSLAELETAKRLNPLNTDHTANLARLYRTWAEFASDAAQRQERLQLASTIYRGATALSPHSAQLQNEWGLVHHLLGDYDAALAAYDRSLALDREFPQTYLLRSDAYLAREDWAGAAEECRKAVELDPALVQGWSAMGYAYSRMEDWEHAIAANLKVYALAPADYNTLKNLAILYDHADQADTAISFAEQAISAASEQERPTMQAFLDDLRQRDGKDSS